MRKQVRLTVLALAIITIGISIVGCGGGGGGGNGGGGTDPVTLSLTLSDWFSPSHATPVPGASIYLVSNNGLSSTRSTTPLTNKGDGTYEWTGSLVGYNAFVVVVPSGYTQGYAGFLNTVTTKIEVYQLPVDISGNFDSPFFDPSQTAVIPLPTGTVNIGNVYVYSEGSSPPPPDHP
jgi:hypothetical protein